MRSVLMIVPLLLCAGPAATQPTQPQSIALYSYGYGPNPIVLTAGRPVTLTFVNRSGKGHDFTAKSFFGASRILAGRVSGSEVDLGPGQSQSVTLVPAAGHYKVHCGRPFHSMLGMRANIVVR